MNDNLVKAFFLAAILVVLLFQSLFTNAEPAKNTAFSFVEDSAFHHKVFPHSYPNKKLKIRK